MTQVFVSDFVPTRCNLFLWRFHGNTGRTPNNQKGLGDIIVKLFTGELYDGSNILHFYELLKKYDNIEVSEGYARTVFKDKLRTDRRTVFTYQLRKNTVMKDDTFTQFGFACSQPGIDIESFSVPEFKGRVERSFQ